MTKVLAQGYDAAREHLYDVSTRQIHGKLDLLTNLVQVGFAEVHLAGVAVRGFLGHHEEQADSIEHLAA